MTDAPIAPNPGQFRNGLLHGSPKVGDTVHYVSYGTPGGEYPSACRAAIVTEVTGDPAMSVGLCVLSPAGQFFNRAVPYDEGSGNPGSGDCNQADVHGNPFRYCPCGWTEPSLRGGTWHWLERA